MALLRFAIGLLLAVIAIVLYQPQTKDSLFYDAFLRKKILLLTAHPDDECLFFSPTLLALRKAADLFSMCLSTGNSEGLGEVRKKELKNSLDVLGIDALNRAVLDHPELQDNITLSWNSEVLIHVVKSFVVKNEIDIILTFDEKGISGHPNHISLPKAMRLMLSSEDAPRLFTLVTVPLLPKYSGIFAPLISKLLHRPNSQTFIASIEEYLIALKAMRQHWSQLVWFRWLNVLFSRYMWVNEWEEAL